MRFVQLYNAVDKLGWDGHDKNIDYNTRNAAQTDQPIAALLADLKQRGLLDSTLVICTSEFGRQPGAQGKGRDHNAGAFTAWLAGGGIKGGTAYGTTDELGSKAEEHPAYSYDLHATALHLLGVDHERLSFYHNGVQRRLTDVHGHVLREILA